MTTPRPRTIVVGAGLGGLAAAIRLLAAGHDVTLLERRERLGGRAYRLQDGGYTWDMGPSLVTMPWLLDELYRAAGTATHDEVTLRPLDPFYRIRWEDDERTFDFGGDRTRQLAEISRFDPRDAARYDDFLDAARRIHEEGILVAGRRPFLSPVDLARLLPTMARLGAIRSLRGFVGRFFRDEHVRMAFDFHSLFIGGDPWRVPAIYAALAYLQIADGVWYTDGGVGSIVDSFGRLIERGGGTIRTGARVAGIEHRDGRVTGVRLEDGERLEADLVVSNADAIGTRTRLLDPAAPDRAPWRWRRPTQTMSCYLLYLGTTRTFPALLHHTLLVGRDYPGFVRAVTREHRVADSLSLYVHAPSRTEPAMAAPGGDSLAILLPVPNRRSRDDWSVRGPELRERILDHLEGLPGLAGLRASIAAEHAFTPDDFARELEAPLGNAFGVEPVLWQSAAFRQPNRDRVVEGLYYVGAGTHPGGGIPGVLLGAEVTSGLIARDLADGRVRPRDLARSGTTTRATPPAAAPRTSDEAAA